MTNYYEMISLACTFASVYLFAYFVCCVLLQPRQDLQSMTSHHRTRIQILRGQSLIFRWFEPLLGPISRHAVTRHLSWYPKLKRLVESGAGTLPFSANELAAVVFLRSCLAGVSGMLLGWFLGSIPAGFLLAVMAFIGHGVCYAFWANSAVRQRQYEISRRLPHTTDLMAMQLTAGSSFRQAFQLTANELQNHALGAEFRRVMRESEHGLSMIEALQSMEQRVANSDVKDFVDSIVASQRRGNPLAKTLRNLSDQMRVRRTERAEKAAGQAQANITFPGLIIMGSCLLILLAPFALQAIQENPFGF